MRTARSSSRLLGVGWGVSASVHAGDPPGVALETCQVWAWRPPQARPLNFPPGVGLETPQARPLNFPPGVALETPPIQTPQLPPRCGPGDLQGMLGYHPSPQDLQGMLGYHHHPMDRMTDTCKNITFANFVCGR